MRRVVYKFVLAALTVGVVVGVPGCGHDQQLVGINIQPQTVTFGASNIPVFEDAGLTTQLTAYGSYIHPPVTKDITDQATWSSSTTEVANVNATGLVTATGDACGNAIITATVTKNSSDGGIGSTGAVVTNFMTATVVCDTSTGIELKANLVGTGAGTISSVPAGLSCASSCSTRFSLGTKATLTATPLPGHTFVGWKGCREMSGVVCVIDNLAGDSAVIAEFK